LYLGNDGYFSAVINSVWELFGLFSWSNRKVFTHHHRTARTIAVVLYIYGSRIYNIEFTPKNEFHVHLTFKMISLPAILFVKWIQILAVVDKAGTNLINKVTTLTTSICYNY
jgi:hypothetical protein